MPAAASPIVRAAVVAVVLAFGGCAGASGDGDGRSLRVLAASSLTGVFRALETEFEAARPGVNVVLHFGSSAVLAEQLRAGAPADVFVSADTGITDRLAGDGVVGPPVAVASNRVALLVARGNPLGIRGLTDLDRPGIVFVMCGGAAPCGRLGDEALRRAGVEARPAAREENVRAVVSRVVLGEADAGIVYVSDVRAAAGRAEGVAIASDLRAHYAAAVVRGTRHREDASAWTDFVRGRRGQKALRAAGFEPPGEDGS